MHPTATESLPASRAGLLGRLGRVRARTLSLVESLSEDALNRVHDPLMSPVVWDLGHIATFEDLWLAQNAFGVPPLREGGVPEADRRTPAITSSLFETEDLRNAVQSFLTEGPGKAKFKGS